MKPQGLFILFSLFCFLHFVSAAQADIQIHWNFENGSLGGWQVNENNEIVLQLSENSGGIWYFFQIRGVKDRRLTFVFESVRNDHFGSLNLPALSYSLSQWEYISDVSVQPNDHSPNTVRYTFSHRFERDTAWLAYTVPFTNRLLDTWTERLASNPFLEIITVTTTSQRQLSLPVLRITDAQSETENKSGWMLLCREDSHESAASWMGMGAALFLLSDDPLARELRQDSVWWIAPIFDRDGVALGRAQHPAPNIHPNLFWTETWQEDRFSFHEQRETKRLLQQIKHRGQSLNGVFRVHSANWLSNVFRPEHFANREIEYAISNELLGQYLPWFAAQEPMNLDTRFSKFAVDLFPKTYAGFFQTDYVLPEAMGTAYKFYKSEHDLMLEGELLVRMLAHEMGYTANSVPPFLLAAGIQRGITPDSHQYNVHAVYFDLFNRPPKYVRLSANGQAFNLTPLPAVEQPPSQGIIYNRFLSLENPISDYVFETSNGQTSITLPKYPIPEVISRDEQ